jgi:hypothetical protein
MKVVVSPQAQRDLEELPQVLYSGNYFSYLETAQAYVSELSIEIVRSLPFYPRRKAPPEYRRYGKNLQYALIKRSKRTQWYAFFNTYHDGAELIYVVRLISNNHVIGKHLQFSQPV